jgi:rubrerythrin
LDVEEVDMAATASATGDNLRSAFAGESQAHQRYRVFAETAEQDGLPTIARLFRTAAEAERIHAEEHLKAMDAVGSTADNLRAALQYETYQYTSMYPPMLAQAETEEHKAKRIFAYAVAAEAVHARLYAMALEAAQEGRDMAPVTFYLCPECGYIEPGQPTENCPISGTEAEKFVVVS